MAETSSAGQFFRETSFIARMYGQSMHDNFRDLAPKSDRKTEFQALQDQFDAEMKKPRPEFSQLLRIEAGLVDIIRDKDLRSRYWTIEDRFHRVVPLSTQASYRASVPAVGAKDWNDPEFIRSQTRTLLSVIHANYLLNMAREVSVRRLMLFLLSAFAVVCLIAAAVFAHYTQVFNLYKVGLALLFFLGSLGALLSLFHRLQDAVTRDAMIEDGIYELTGLRIGWLGILISLFMGGAFAVVFYGIVMANLLSVSEVRVSTAEPPTASSSASASDDDEASDLAPEAKSVTLPSPGIVAKRENIVCKQSDKSQCVTVENLATVMGFVDMTSFYKMLIYAFLAGFAERLVPDILNRLSKRSD